MGLILKTTFKNIIKKPFRTILVILSIFVCAFAAMFCFDLSIAEKGVIMNIYSGILGDADIVVMGGNPDMEMLPEDFPEYSAMEINTFTDYIYTDIPGEYAFASQDEIKIYGLDMQQALNFHLLDDYELSESEAVITDKAAEAYGCQEGDVITVHDNSGDPVDITVVKIIPSSQTEYLRQGSCIIVNADTSNILSCGKKASSIYVLNIIDNDELSSAEDILKTTFPNSTIESFALDETTEAMLNQILGFMFLLFAIAFLLVVFITASISNRIVNERMSFIGTLRSLGMSARNTCFVLLLENILYALLGAIPGVWLYSSIRDPFFDIMFTVKNSDGETLNDLPIPSLSMVLVAAVIIGAVLVECLIPLKAQLKALHTSIRDIIFDNRDTEYKFSRFGTAFGIVLALVAVVTFFLRKDLFAAAICLISSVTAVALLYPYVLKWVTALIAKTSAKNDHEKWALAAVEAGTRKSSVSSGTLCVTSATMCIIIVTIATSIMALFNANPYNCNVKVSVTDQPKYYSFVEHMDGVTDMEYVYDKMDMVTINGENKTCQIYGLPEGGYSLYNGLYDLPETMEDGTVLVEKYWANLNGYSIGDTIEMTFDPYGVFPIERTFTIAAFYKIDKAESMNNTFVLTKSDFISIFHDFPGMLLINSDNPEQTAAAIETYAVGKVESSQTIEQYFEDNKSQNKAVVGSIYVVMIMAIAMTFIGMGSNQLIGFEGRKKECAVMVSTAMSKKTLSGVLFREMLITSFVSATIGAVLGTVLLSVIESAIKSSDVVSMAMTIDPKHIIGLWVIMIFVFALTVLFPIRNLKKMKLSEQLKYE